MIEIHPLREKDKLEKLYKEKKISFNDNSIAVVASDGDDIIGTCLFELFEKDMTIHHVSPTDDIMFADGILRSALHVGVENGIKCAFYSKTAPEDLIKKLGFLKNTENNELKVELLFTSCGSCEK